MRRLAIVTLLLMLLIPSYAQEGQGIIRTGIVSDLDESVGSFNPLRCDNSACDWAVEYLFPHLLAIDPETHWYGVASVETGGLATSWDISDDNKVYHFHLREDAFWSDGTPITAYDYFYSYLAITSQQIQSPYATAIRNNIAGVVPLSATELVIIFKENNCDVLPLIDFPVAPAHAFDNTFAAQAVAFFNDEDVREQWTAWDESYDYDFSFMVGHPFDTLPSVTGGEFEFVSWQPKTYIRLRHGDLAYELVPVPSDDELVNRFLNGELTLLDNPLQNRWVDIVAAQDVQTYQAPTTRWDYLAFNLANPRKAHSAFDEDGNAIEQEPNPFFVDIRVRQAIQMAINVPALIEVGLQGQGRVIPANQAPLSWAYDANLAPLTYDPDAARALLEEAGWVQYRGRSSRQCLHCGTAEDGTALTLNFAYGSLAHHGVIASLIEQQLRRVGVAVGTYPSDLSSVTYQDFDLYLGTWQDSYPVSVGMHRIFIPQADVVGTGWDFTSYNNPEVTALIEQAQTVAGCSLDERRDLYQQAQTILQQDLPYVWLYAHDERIAVRGSVQHFTPIVGQPLANIADWVIFEIGRESQ